MFADGSTYVSGGLLVCPLSHSPGCIALSGGTVQMREISRCMPSSGQPAAVGFRPSLFLCFSTGSGGESGHFALQMLPVRGVFFYLLCTHDERASLVNGKYGL